MQRIFIRPSFINNNFIFHQFHTTSKHLSRRKAAQNSSFEGFQPFLKIKSLSGNIDEDGLHKYELDFFETAEWTISILQSMRNDLPILKQKHESPFLSLPILSSAIQHQNPLIAIQTIHHYPFDFSKPPIHDSSVIIHVNMNEMSLTESQNHKLKLLAMDMYDESSHVLSLKEDECMSTNENITLAALKLKKVLAEVMDNSKDSFSDIPVEAAMTSSAQATKIKKKRNVFKNLEFPEEWLNIKNLPKENKQSLHGWLQQI